MERRGLLAATRAKASTFEDHRGKLTVVPFEELPFVPARAYVISELPSGERRGGHASRTQHRLLVGLSGRARVTLDDGLRSARIELCESDELHIPPRTWLEIEALHDGVAILVFADGPYDPSDHLADRSLLPIARHSASQTSEA